jgi:nicotinate-nucleotide pyrophosphorylase (carboxylating)
MTNDELIIKALKEDIGRGDITSQAIIPKDQKAKARIIAKETGIVAGLSIGREVYRALDRSIRFSPKVKDGKRVKKGTIIAEVSGNARAILAGERVALNFLQHLSGIATLTHKFVSRLSFLVPRPSFLDTRKTTPGLRALEKYAVRVGGGVNHRMGLYDAVLIKDNHIKLAGGIDKAILKVRGMRYEVEAKTIDEVKKAIKGKANRILLDNMNIKTLRQAVKLCRRAGVKTEASGGVNLQNVRAIAKTGVDYISVGALTHSAPALDISLKII